MPKSPLEKSITEAAQAFALEVVEAVKAATLQELMALQAGEAPAPSAKPGPKPGRKPGRPAGKKRGRKPGPKPKAEKTVAVAAKPPVTKKKSAKKRNYPKCAYPDCNKNRFARGLGFCGEHWKQSLAGKIKDADFYLKKAK